MLRNCLVFGAIFTTALTAVGGERVFDFDDGTFQGWLYVDNSGEPLVIGSEAGQSLVGWAVTIDEVDAGGGEGFNVLQGSSEYGIGEVGNPQRIPNYRVLPEPFELRDGGGLSQRLQSPIFQLDDSGPIAVDMIGGQAQGGRSFDPDNDVPPEYPDDHGIDRGPQGWQGFALYDVAADAYVRWGFPSINNDGKERDGRDVWETVTIPQEDLVDLANDGKDYRLDIFDSYAGGWGWIGFDTVRIPDASVIAGTIAGDCDGDGLLSAADLGCVATISDRDAVLAGLNTLPGDLNGDGNVAFEDFLIVSSNFNTEQSTYSAGNIDLQGTVDFADFLVLSSNFGKTPTSGATAASVPEPTSSCLLLLAVIGILRFRGRR